MRFARKSDVFESIQPEPLLSTRRYATLLEMRTDRIDRSGLVWRTTPMPGRCLISLPDAAISRRLQERTHDVVTLPQDEQDPFRLRFEICPSGDPTGDPVGRHCGSADQGLLLIEEPILRHLRRPARTSHWRSLTRR
jgi:hypothetical protein